MTRTFSIQSYYVDIAKKYQEDGPFWNHENRPDLVTLKPTLRCMAKCKHCEARLKDFDDYGEETFDIEGYKRLFLSLRKLGTKKITISGGEPLAYRYTKELIYYASAEGMSVTLNTNGWMLDKKRFRGFLDAGLMGVNLSIDHPDAKVHDKLRHLPGLFDRATTSILEVQELGDFLLNIRMVLHRYTYKHVVEMIELCKRLNADVLSIDMIENDYLNNLFLLDETQITEFNDVIKESIVKKLYEVDFDSNELRMDSIKQVMGMFDTSFNSILNFSNGIYWPDAKVARKCSIPNSFMIIEGNGQVLPCNAVEYRRDKIVGNAIKDPIEEIWDSEKFNNFREQKMDFCRKCPMNMSHMIKFRDRELVARIPELT